MLPTGGSSLEVFTTRPDTLFGATYMVIAPEHSQLQALTSDEQREEVQSYVRAAGQKSDLERTELQKQKSGVFTGKLRASSCDQATRKSCLAFYFISAVWAMRGLG